MNDSERITIEAGKCAGKPCIRGLRITVYDVLSWLANGMTGAEIIEDYPELMAEDKEADHNDHSEGHAERGPFLAFYGQLACANDIGDIAGDKHTACDEQAHKGVFDSIYGHSGGYFRGGQCRVIENRRGDIHPVKG